MKVRPGWEPPVARQCRLVYFANGLCIRSNLSNTRHGYDCEAGMRLPRAGGTALRTGGALFTGVTPTACRTRPPPTLQGHQQRPPCSGAPTCASSLTRCHACCTRSAPQTAPPCILHQPALPGAGGCPAFEPATALTHAHCDDPKRNASKGLDLPHGARARRRRLYMHLI